MNRKIYCRSFKRTIYLIVLSLCVQAPLLLKAQYNPRNYWTFEGNNPMADSMNNANLNPSYYNSVYTIGNGKVGKALNLGNLGRTIVGSNVVNCTNAVTIEFLFKPDPLFNTSTMISRRDGAIQIKMGYPFIQFVTSIKSPAGATIFDNFQIDLEGINRGSYGYYVDGNYHHMVFRYNTATGVKEVWVDGQLPAGFSKNTGTGTFAANSSNPSMNYIDISSNTSYSRINGSIDEIAFYNIDLPSTQIYKHYGEIKLGKHYSFGSSSILPPAAQSISGPVNAEEYAPGHPAYTQSAISQLQNAPLPRYKKNHTLLPNFNWMGLTYFSGYYQPGVSYAQAVSNSVAIQSELGKNWNYSILVSSNTSAFGQYNDPTKFSGAWVQLANQNPQIHASCITFWAQLNPQSAGFSSNVGYIENKNLPVNHYLRNGSGQFLNTTGSITSNRFWSPAAPVDSFIKDGQTQKFYLQHLLSSLSRPLNLICENAEVIPKHNISAMQQDPAVTADKNNSGLDWESYLGNRKKRVSNVYRNQLFTLPGLQNTLYTEYQISGSTSRHKYSEARQINTLKNNQIYATPDFYPRWPSNWLTGTGAWNGWNHVIEGRYYELQQNDKLFSPFIAAGWNADEERNIRPAQWLGLLKALNMTGAEFFYTGYFNEASSYIPPNPAPVNPAGYAYQALMPSYAQAVCSYYEDILRNGSLLAGDRPFSVSNTLIPGYAFNAGDPRKLVVVRKHNASNKYAITGSIQPNSNMDGNAELSADASIQLNGQNLQFKIRRQGSTYIYDNSNPTAPVFYQLDSWHEHKHPSYWKQDFEIEAELFNNAASGASLKTYRASGSNAGDFRNATTAVNFANSNSNSFLEYPVTPRSNAQLYLWVRARSITGSNGSLETVMNSQNSRSIGCINDTAWNWYSFDACSGTAISYTNLPAQQECLFKIRSTQSNIEIDRILLTTDAGLNLNTTQQACLQNGATVSASGPLTFCQGDSVILTASPASNYTWSNGSTQSAIVVKTSGTYSVMTGNGSCSMISNPITVTVLSSPPASIAANGPLSLCTGQTVTLSASTGASYLWSDGSTTQSITVSAAGNYQVTVSAGNGCQSVSAPVSVQSFTAPPNTVTASGPLSFCQGGNVQFTAPQGFYYQWSTGATTQQISVSSSGTYSVTISNGSGCVSTSTPLTVQVFAQPQASISVNGPTVLGSGQSTLLSASAGSSYLWSPGGQTSQSIIVTTAGVYSVQIGNSGNCSSISAPVVIQQAGIIPVLNVATSGPLSFCTGDSVSLQASGSMTYTWNPGNYTGNKITIYQSGIYTVDAYDANGVWVDADTFQVTAHPLPMPVSISSSYIPNAAYQLTAYEPSALSYQWSNGVTNPTITVSQPGNYTVKAMNGFGCLSASSSVSINSIQAKNCVTPDLLLSGDLSSSSARLTWNQAHSAEAFDIYYRPAGSLNWNMRRVNGNIHSIEISSLNTGTLYEWYVNSVCLSGINTSSTEYFTTLSGSLACGSTPQHTRTEQITHQSADLKWYPVIAQSYTLTYRAIGNANWNTVSLTGSSLLGTTLNGLQPLTTYEWKVQTNCNGVLSAFSTPEYFTTADTCGYLGNLSVPEINPSSATLQWTSTVTMDSIQIKLINTKNNAVRIYYCLGNPTDGKYRIRQLSPHTTYLAQVKGKCQTGSTNTSWSNIVTFNTGNIISREEDGNTLGLNAYPNPVQDILFYSFESEEESDYLLRVCDMAGREISRENRSSMYGAHVGEVNVQSLAKGLYLLVVTKGTQSGHFRFTVD